MSRVKFIEIEGRKIGEGLPVLIIAEAEINDNGDIKIAQRMIDMAVDAKVNAVKLQTLRTERLVSKNAWKAQYQQRGTDSSGGQKGWLESLELNREQHLFSKRYAERKRLISLYSIRQQKCRFIGVYWHGVCKISSRNVTNTIGLISCKRLLTSR